MEGWVSLALIGEAKIRLTSFIVYVYFTYTNTFGIRYFTKDSAMTAFRGTYTVLITPMTADGTKVDVAALKKLVDWQIEQGIHGLIPLGSTGEFLSLTPEERQTVIET